MNAKRILIVDDNPVLVKGVSNVLAAAGYEVLQAEDGAGAVSTVRQERPDLVLLDISFPPDVAHGGGVPWDGFLIMNWLRRMPEVRDIPIAIISGADKAQYGPRAIKAGAVAYIHKPFEPEELLNQVKQIIGEPKASAAQTTEEEPIAAKSS